MDAIRHKVKSEPTDTDTDTHTIITILHNLHATQSKKRAKFSSRRRRISPKQQLPSDLHIRIRGFYSPPKRVLNSFDFLNFSTVSIGQRFMCMRTVVEENIPRLWVSNTVILDLFGSSESALI